MKKLSKFIYSKSNLAACIILTIIMVMYASIIMGYQSDCIELSDGTSLLGLRFGYSYESVLDLFNSLSLSSLKCYSTLLKIWDNIFPFIYGSMYISWLSLIYKNYRFKNNRLRIINLYPLIPLALDLIENYFENGMLTTFIRLNKVFHVNVKIASIITQFKWTFSTINYIIILVGIILLIKNKLNTTSGHK